MAGVASATYHGLVTASNTALITPFVNGVFGRLVDNGEGSNDPPDANLHFLTGPPSDSCTPVNIPALPVTQGNIAVHDGI